MRALDTGADDYIVKPFGDRDLIARAHLRRGARDRESQSAPAVFEIGPLRMNVDERSVVIDGKDVHVMANGVPSVALLDSSQQRRGVDERDREAGLGS